MRPTITRTSHVRSRIAIKGWLKAFILDTRRVRSIVNAAMDQNLHSVAALAEVADIVVCLCARSSLSIWEM